MHRRHKTNLRFSHSTNRAIQLNTSCDFNIDIFCFISTPSDIFTGIPSDNVFGWLRDSPATWYCGCGLPLNPKPPKDEPRWQNRTFAKWSSVEKMIKCLRVGFVYEIERRSVCVYVCYACENGSSRVIESIKSENREMLIPCSVAILWGLVSWAEAMCTTITGLSGRLSTKC